MRGRGRACPARRFPIGGRLRVSAGPDMSGPYRGGFPASSRRRQLPRVVGDADPYGVVADSISARCRSRHRQPPRGGINPFPATLPKHTYLFYSIPANSARISALISSTERMDFAPFASAAVHSMRCQPSVRAQYSAAARLRARYSVSFS